MPKFALTNLCWGGREHPAYQGLTPATRALLGRGRAIHRMLILRHADQGSEAASKALTGNTVLVAQPKTSAILAELPPDEPEMSDSLNVVFATARSDISKHKSLPVPRERYVKCALLRKAVCLAFGGGWRAAVPCRSSGPAGGGSSLPAELRRAGHAP